jgi:hypothetical protein
MKSGEIAEVGELTILTFIEKEVKTRRTKKLKENSSTPEIHTQINAFNREMIGMANYKKKWRKCMGIEPTCRPLRRHTGFEVREPHQ